MCAAAGCGRAWVCGRGWPEAGWSDRAGLVGGGYSGAAGAADGDAADGAVGAIGGAEGYGGTEYGPAVGAPATGGAGGAVGTGGAVGGAACGTACGGLMAVTWLSSLGRPTTAMPVGRERARSRLLLMGRWDMRAARADCLRQGQPPETSRLRGPVWSARTTPGAAAARPRTARRLLRGTVPTGRCRAPQVERTVPPPGHAEGAIRSLRQGPAERPPVERTAPPEPV